MKWFKSVSLSSSDTSRFQCLSAYIKVGLMVSELGEPTSSLCGPARRGSGGWGRGTQGERTGGGVQQPQSETLGFCCLRISAIKVFVWRPSKQMKLHF